MSNNYYASLFANTQGRCTLGLITDRGIREEYAELSALRNSRLEDDADVADVICWLEECDDGCTRRYVPIDVARRDGVHKTRYGRMVSRSAADVRDILGEIRHGECADGCGATGPITDTPSGELIRGGESLGCVTLGDAESYLCGSAHNGEPVCEDCERERDAQRSKGGAQ